MKNIPNNIINQFKLWQYIIDNAPDFTPEVEELCDRIACYCVEHDISIDEYESIIYG